MMSLENFGPYEEGKEKIVSDKKVQENKINTKEVIVYAKRMISFSPSETQETDNNIKNFQNTLLNFKKDGTDYGLAETFAKSLNEKTLLFLTAFLHEAQGKPREQLVNEKGIKTLHIKNDHNEIIQQISIDSQNLTIIARQLIEIEKTLRSTRSYFKKMTEGKNTTNTYNYEVIAPIEKDLAKSIPVNLWLHADQEDYHNNKNIDIQSILTTFDENLVQAIKYCGGEYDPSEIIIPDQEEYERTKPQENDKYYTQQQNERNINRQLDQYSN